MVVARSRSALHRTRMVEGTEGSHHKEGSTKMQQHNMVCAGIDTGKRKLDVALTDGRRRLQTDNNAAGHVALSAWLRKHRVKRVGIEASGGYEHAVVATLRRDGLLVIVFQPAQVRAYAKFHLQRAKNDKIDAALIATCTAATQKIHAPPDPRLAPFAEHLTLVEQITEDIAHVKTRRESCRDHRIRRHWDGEIARLKTLLKAELEALITAVRQHRDLSARLDLIASISGIGLKTAVAILLRMPEIGRVSREQAAALAGLAPYDDDSGDQVGSRHIDGGRQRLRKSLYAAALAAAFHWNPQLNVIYRRLIAAGKPHKVALVACARKLLIYANTVVERGTPWTQRPAPI
jgi:transposase